MKKVVFTLLLVLVMLYLFVGCGRDSAHGKLQIIFSGNIKGNTKPCGCHVSKGGVARLATFVNRIHDSNSNWLMVDAGNYVDRAGNNGGCTSKCAFMISSYQDLKYDVLNLGRSEVFMGCETIKALRDSAKSGTEFVSANLLDKKSGKLIVKPYVIKKYRNMQVAIIGLLNQADFTSVSTIDTNRLKVASYIETAQKYIPALSKNNDAVIVLGDLSSAAIDSLTREVQGIDFVISSGSVSSGENGTWIKKTRVIGTGTSGYNGHSTILEFNPLWKDSIAFSDYNVPLDSSFQEPGQWADRLAAFENGGKSPAMNSSVTTPSPTDVKGISSQPNTIKKSDISAPKSVNG